MYYESILPKIWTIKTQEWFYAFITSLTIFNKSYGWIRVTQNIPASLETTNSNDCWLDGEWTEFGGCGNEVEAIPLRPGDWTPSPTPDWDATDEPWELNCTYSRML